MRTRAFCASVVVAVCLGAAQAQQSPAALAQRMPDDLYLSASKGDKVALQRLMSLAESGNAQAQFHLGEVYSALMTGDTFGVPKDAVKSAAWYGKAAEPGMVRRLNKAILLTQYLTFGCTRSGTIGRHWIKSQNWRARVMFNRSFGSARCTWLEKAFPPTLFSRRTGS